MPKSKPGIPDSLLLTQFSQLDVDVQITPAQVAMLLSKTTKQLADDRAAGNPPAFTKDNGSIKYSIGAVRDHITRNTFRSTAEASKAVLDRISGLALSFSAFMNEGKAEDVWPFMMEGAKPIELFYSLTSGVSDEAVGAWLTLDEYLRARQESALQAQADAETAELVKLTHGLPNQRKLVDL